MRKLVSLEVQTSREYCPHTMGDLSKGQIIDDCLVCPNHGWQFSLKDGLCLNSQVSIKISKFKKTPTKNNVDYNVD